MRGTSWLATFLTKTTRKLPEASTAGDVRLLPSFRKGHGVQLFFLFFVTLSWQFVMSRGQLCLGIDAFVLRP